MKVAALPAQRARLAKLIGVDTERGIFDSAHENQFLYCEHIRCVIGNVEKTQENAQEDAPFWKQQFADASNPSKQRRETCPQCRSRNTVLLRAAQLRSADEGHTLTFECSDCKTRWNVNT